jgi:TonB family protein
MSIMIADQDKWVSPWKCIAIFFSGMAIFLSDFAYADPFQDGLAAARKGDFAAARNLWLPLAELGHPDAQVNLAMLYAEGKGVPPDKPTAVWWNNVASRRNFWPAQSALGYMYATGSGVPESRIKALTWYLLATSAPGQQAEVVKRNRDALQSSMTVQEIKQANETADLCLRTKFKECEPSVPTEGETMLPIYSPLGSPPTPPVALTRHVVEAKDYPVISLQRQEQGRIDMEYLVRDDGKVSACAVRESTTSVRLAQAACSIVKQWIYKPALQDGRPIAVGMTAAVIFQLR